MERQNELEVTLRLNGRERTATIDRRMLLVEALRERFDTTGPKIGCATGDCGACTVALDGEITKSCLKLAAAVDGAEVITIEGLADAELSPLQRAFWDEHAFQCGFCLSGMLFAAHDLLSRNPNPTDEEIRWAVSGSLCRCTGYENIVAAVRVAAQAAQIAAPPAG